MLLNECRLLCNQIKESFKSKKYQDSFLLVILVVQYIICVIFNFTEIKSHVGFDSSWSMLKTVLVWREKTLFSPMWIDQSNMLLDSVTFFAIPVYGVTKDIFFSFALVNVIVLLLLLLTMSCILSEFEIGITAKLLVLNLIVCPFLTNGFYTWNDIMYFSNIAVGAAHSAVRSLIALLIIYCYIRLKKSSKYTLITYITLAMCILTGIGTGVFMIIMILFPCLLYELEIVLIKNDYSVLKNKESVFLFLASLCVCVGRGVAGVLSPYGLIDTSRTWTSIENILVNILALFQGMFGLLEALPLTDQERISIFSPLGINYFFPIAILAFLFISFFYCVFKIKKDYETKSGLVHFIVNIIVVNCIVFCFFNVNYGSTFFEDRYLITTYFAALILLAFFYNNLDSKKIITSWISIALLISVVYIDLSSDITYAITESTKKTEAEEIICYLDSQTDAELIYVWGIDESDLEAKLRIYDLDRYYKLIYSDGVFFHWGDYLYYDNNTDYSGPTYLITNNNDERIPEHVFDDYEVVKTIGDYTIYRSGINPIDYTETTNQLL